MTEFTLTCDRPCMTTRGLLIHPGTQVVYISRSAAFTHATRVRMADGSEEEVTLACFREWRALDAFKQRMMRHFTAGSGSRDEVLLLARTLAAIAALPNRDLLQRLPPAVYNTIVVQLSQVLA